MNKSAEASGLRACRGWINSQTVLLYTKQYKATPPLPLPKGQEPLPATYSIWRGRTQNCPFFTKKTTKSSNRKSNSSIFHVKYNISGMPTLQFPYFPASFRHADSTVSLFSTHRFDDFPSFQHVGSFKPYSVVPRTPKNMPFACMRANYTYFKRRKKRNASCLRTRMQIACFPSMLE